MLVQITAINLNYREYIEMNSWHSGTLSPNPHLSLKIKLCRQAHSDMLPTVVALRILLRSPLVLAYYHLGTHPHLT